MPRQRKYVGAVGIVAVLVAVLAFQPRSGGASAGSVNCASAPSTPRASFESAHDNGIQQSHFGGFDGTFVSARVPSRSLVGYAGHQANELAFVREPLYGSLFRRPPPSLS